MKNLQNLLLIFIVLMIALLKANAQTQLYANKKLPLAKEKKVNGDSNPGIWAINPKYSKGFRIAAPEVCDNGIDDDEDGFIDRFDSDCPCAITDYGSYVSNCTPSCSYQFVAQPLAIAQQWTSAPNVGLSYNTPLVADVDNDGVSEVIVQASTSLDGDPRVAKNIFVLNGEDGTLQTTITTPFMDWSATVSMAIADVDDDGFGEIIIASSSAANNVAGDQRYLYCYERDGTLLWKSNARYAANQAANRGGGSPGIADFNHDGIPEVYIHNEIFNARTGVKLIDGGANGIGSNFSNGTVATWANSVAADFIPASASLELAAGRTVYSVKITNAAGTAGNTMTATNLAFMSDGTTPAIDGITSAADINLDGVLDVIVTPTSSTHGLYVWDARTATLIASQTGALSGSSAGVAFVGDVDNDGDPDIGYCRVNRLYMLSYSGTTSLATKWVLTTSDGSGVTGMSMFDFNQDGKAEIVYRDETQLRIIDGSTATPANLAVISNTSGTALEMPVVADIDNDGQAEIVIGDQTGLPTGGTGYIKAYKSNGQPWAPARNVWNQLGYHNTNIDDHLKVPVFEQNYSLIFNPTPGACAGSTQRPLNNFLQQASPRDRSGCLAYPSSDATLSNVSIECGEGNTIKVTYTVGNIGEASLLAETPISFYAGDPLTTAGAKFTLTETIGSVLANGGSKVITTTVDYTGTATPFNLYLSVNDDGLSARPFTFPTTAIPECNYGNNTVSIEVQGLNVGGSIYIDDSGLADGVNGTLANGPSLGATGLHVTLLVGASGTTQQAVTSVDATGKFLFTNVPEGTYRLVLGTTATGSTDKQLPDGYFTIGEGGPIVSGNSSGDGTNDGVTTITADCAGITYQNARIAANIEYLQNNFAISTIDPLPVNLISFTAVRSEKSAYLRWSTSAETNSERFEVQRSTNGTEWLPLENIVAKGQSNVTQSYLFVDRQPQSGENLYRLKMIDRDQSFAYSRIRSVSFDTKFESSIYPNPVDDKLQIKVTDWKQIRSISIVNSTGTLVYNSGRVESGFISTKNLLPGLYILKITHTDGSEHLHKVLRSK